MAYDIIGDVHGCARTLEALLEKLGYRERNGVFCHKRNTAVFLGDFIDRGPRQRRVIDIVRPMIESGSALSVMGNHEYNATAWATRADDSNEFLRPHSDRNKKQHIVFLDAFQNHQDACDDVIDWFKTLPLWLDLGDLRIVHACWDRQFIARIQSEYGDNKLSDTLLHDSSRKGGWQYEALETLLKGKEIPLPDGSQFHDKDGNPRQHIRVRWWDQSARTYREAFMGPDSALAHIPDEKIIGDHLIDYTPDAPPVFLGHYWMEGHPEPLSANIACVDYSVAKPGGKLVAYRWSGEDLSSDRFVWVDRID